ncbi:MAG: hypothetical protein VKN56_03305, partial [Cyanobacteriota bacterium]|nr:hypothetical protein [Cyanobacteriota bacterium]
MPPLIFEYLDFLRPDDIDAEDPPIAQAQPRLGLPSPQGPSGYLVSSTAPENVEDYLPASLARSWQKATGREGEI